MPNGTYMNEVFAPRLFKSNAQEMAYRAERNIQAAIRELTGLAYATPTAEEKETLHSRIDDLVQGLLDDGWELSCATYIIENPDLCIDESEEGEEGACQHCGQTGFHKMSCDNKEKE